MKPALLILAVLLLCALATDSQQPAAAPNKDACKDAILEKEISDFTRIVEADGDRLKIGFLVEHITWADDYRRVASDVIQTRFASKFVDAGDRSLGVITVYISGTPV